MVRAGPPAITPASRTPHNVTAAPADYFAALESLRDRLKAEPGLVILFDDSFKGDDIRALVEFGESLGIPVKYICLVDYSNSRGAIDMGLAPEFLPGYVPSGQPGMRLHEMLDAPLDVLWVVGANPLKNGGSPQGRISSSSRTCSSPRPPGRPTWSCPPPVLTKRTAPSPTSPAKCSASNAPSTPWAPSPISRSWASSPGKWAPPPPSAHGRPMSSSTKSAATFAGTTFQSRPSPPAAPRRPLPVNGRVPVENRPDLVRFRSQRPVRVRYARALFQGAELGRGKPFEPLNGLIYRHQPHQDRRRFRGADDHPGLPAMGRAESDRAYPGAPGTLSRGPARPACSRWPTSSSWSPRKT